MVTESTILIIILVSLPSTIKSKNENLLMRIENFACININKCVFCEKLNFVCVPLLTQIVHIHQNSICYQSRRYSLLSHVDMFHTKHDLYSSNLLAKIYKNLHQHPLFMSQTGLLIKNKSHFLLHAKLLFYGCLDFIDHVLSRIQC